MTATARAVTGRELRLLAALISLAAAFALSTPTPVAGFLDQAPAQVGTGASAATIRVPVHPGVTATLQSKPRNTGWRWPLIGRITQRFGQSLTVYGYHYGIDIDGDTGDPVGAAHSGTVTVAGDIGGCGGLQVQVDIGGGIVTVYHHFSSISVSTGDVVAAGERIGRVGTSGCVTGSHLHFAVRVDGTFVDPLRYLPAR